MGNGEVEADDTLTVSKNSQLSVEDSSSIVAGTIKLEGNVEIISGTYIGDFELGENASLVISGGTFSKDPSMYCVDGYTGYQLPDGNYGVIAADEASQSAKATVSISVIPADANVEVVKDGVVIGSSAGTYTLPGGTYSYTVSAYGYTSEVGSFTVAGDDLIIEIRLTYIPNILALIAGAEAPADRFVDVDAGAWYYDAVNYVVESGLMTGMSEDSFAPNGTMTRAMVWTVLGRMAGQEFDGTGANWYAEAQNWAIAAGVSDGSNPNGAITREELVTMLWRFVGSPAAAENVLQWYGDEASVADWASDAMNWAVSRQIIEGTNWNLNPQATALRCQVAAILMRYCKF